MRRITLGATSEARMPMMTTTTMISISVNRLLVQRCGRLLCIAVRAPGR
jgi:hypothetical protein